MTRLPFSAAAAFLAAAVSAAPFTPRIELTITPNEIYVTREAEAEIAFVLPGRLRGNPRISADFIPRDARLELRQSQIERNGTNFVRYATRVKIPAGEPGLRTLGPVTVGLPAGKRSPFGRRSPFDSMFDDDFFGIQQYADFRSGTATLVVKEPPREGRPASDVGAIASDLEAVARLSANVCTAGDPLLFSVTIRATTDFSRVRPPVPPKSPYFQCDDASLKTESGEGFKRFTWRVRTRKAATTEFPACEIGWFDPEKACWRTLRTAPIPIQVRAGVQVALGDTPDAAADVFPMPDGLELDFPQDDFTLRHALSLACRATSEKEFAKAADVYREYLEKTYGDDAFDFGFLNPFDKTAPLRAKHFRNLAALRTLGGASAEAIRACTRAEWLVGATPGSTRNMRAALAKLRDDPRAELPIPRLFFPFFYALSFRGRLLAGFGGVVLIALILALLGRRGRQGVTFLLAVSLACAAEAQFPFSGFGRRMTFDGAPMARPRGSVRLEPARVAVGQPAAFVFSFKTGGADETVDRLRFGGLPEGGIEYGEIETLPGNVFRLPVRFMEPFSNRVAVVAAGMMTKTLRSGNFTSSSSVNFQDDFKPILVVVEPLPEKGRPADFGGAIGENVSLVQTCEPAAVHPGDLVTMTYRLRFTGHCPSNAVPKPGRAAADFKTYPIKETARTRGSVTWTQMIVPRTAAATNAMTATFAYYDTAARRYREAAARPIALAFVSDKAASTRNTAVVVNDASPASAAKSGNGPLVLLFAPHPNAPVTATLPPGTPATESGTAPGGWKRLVTDRAAGWTR